MIRASCLLHVGTLLVASGSLLAPFSCIRFPFASPLTALVSIFATLLLHVCIDENLNQRNTRRKPIVLASFFFEGRRGPTDPPSPAGRGVSVQDRKILTPCERPSKSTTPCADLCAPPPPRPPQISLSQFLTNCFADHRNFQKVNVFESLPKPQKSSPRLPTTSIWNHFGRLLASLLRDLLISHSLITR